MLLKLDEFKISLHSPYKSKKETWAICYEKERERVEKRVGKDDEKSVKKG